MTKSLYDNMRGQENISRAWCKVRLNAKNSKSEQTKKEIQRFEEDLFNNLRKIKDQLRENRYIFKPAKGVAIKRENKNPRPLVVSTIPDRIIQRAILNVLYNIAEVKNYISVPTSFGGIEGRQVSNAIEAACRALKNGYDYHIRSDIKNFYTRIPRKYVLSMLYRLLPDESLNVILEAATTTELENDKILRENRQYFPTEDEGMPQGGCLSQLFGNLLLHEFDSKLNTSKSDVVCFRFVDDFLILGKDKKVTDAAFVKATEILKKYGMDAYSPYTSKHGDTKACAYNVSKASFNFLGCEISKSFVHPGRDSRKKIKEKIRQLLKTSCNQISSNNTSNFNKDFSVIQTLQKAHRILEAWGNQYAFCNAKNLFESIDKEIDDYLRDYLEKYYTTYRRSNASMRTTLGIYLLSEYKAKPILSRIKQNSYPPLPKPASLS